MEKYYFTSESVTEGHPDKICDQISDAILDECLRQDPSSRVACETLAETDAVHIMGEITTNAVFDPIQIAREVIAKIGYTIKGIGFDAKTVKITCSLHTQSSDIAQGVNHALDDENENGAGDQGMMFGYATNETEECMPLTVVLANDLTKRLTKVRKEGILPYLRPDGKSQVTVEFHDGKAARVDAVVVSSQHSEEVSIEQLRKEITEEVIKKCQVAAWMDENTKIYINPTGRFVIGGPAGDTGLTGRKIIADTYGGVARHGGGAFSGKDPSKVDRSAAYMARYIAKNIVANRIAEKCEIELSYAIGVARPVSIFVDTFHTGIASDSTISEWVSRQFDLRPSRIIEKLQLCRQHYMPTAAYGHFGRSELGVSWEEVDLTLADKFQSYLNQK